MCTTLISAIQTRQAELVEQLKERQEEAERMTEELLDELEREIVQLQTRSEELQDLELTQNSLHLLQVRYPTATLQRSCAASTDQNLGPREKNPCVFPLLGLPISQ